MQFSVGDQTFRLCAILINVNITSDTKGHVIASCSETREDVLLTFIQPQSHIFQNGKPMLFQPCEKSAFLLKSALFLITLKVGGRHVSPLPPLLLK